MFFPNHGSYEGDEDDNEFESWCGEFGLEDGIVFLVEVLDIGKQLVVGDKDMVPVGVVVAVDEVGAVVLLFDGGLFFGVSSGKVSSRARPLPVTSS